MRLSASAVLSPREVQRNILPIGHAISLSIRADLRLASLLAFSILKWNVDNVIIQPWNVQIGTARFEQIRNALSQRLVCLLNEARRLLFVVDVESSDLLPKR